MYYVYILRSSSTGKTYVGQTENLTRRVQEHNDPDHNTAKFTTKNPGPWLLIHDENFSTRSEAMQREKYLKSGVDREWIKANILKDSF